jgi:putative tryptophan/tyrosine transport system substrate-binding protein
MPDVGRREFAALLGGAAVAWPLAARAQQPAMPVVGFLSDSTPNPRLVAAFRDGLAEAGFVEGRNVMVEYRSATQWSRLEELAADFVHQQVRVIVALGGAWSALAAKQATTTIPIVVAGGADPVTYGLVASLNRPGGNVTGVTFMSIELSEKRFDLLCEMVPHATTVAYLSAGPTLAFKEEVDKMHAAARALGRQVMVLEARSDRDVEQAFSTLVERGAGAIIVGVAPYLFYNRDVILAEAARHKIPAIYPHGGWVAQGGLMSYGANSEALLHQVGVEYVGRLLKGTKAADLPVQRPTKFELVINLKTANDLGLAVPRMLRVRADRLLSPAPTR